MSGDERKPSDDMARARDILLYRLEAWEAESKDNSARLGQMAPALAEVSRDVKSIALAHAETREQTLKRLRRHHKRIASLETAKREQEVQVATVRYVGAKVWALAGVLGAGGFWLVKEVLIPWASK